MRATRVVRGACRAKPGKGRSPKSTIPAASSRKQYRLIHLPNEAVEKFTRETRASLAFLHCQTFQWKRGDLGRSVGFG